MNSIERIYEAIVHDDIALVFALLIVGVFCLTLLARVPAFRRGLAALERSGPTLMTTLGVLGTFTGIFIGLLDFDVANTDRSIPQLLEGLKIAFSTSIVGMAAAVMAKLFQAIVPQSLDTQTEIGPEEIHSALLKLNGAVENAAQAESAALEALRRAISADSDSSLLTQIQKLRTTIQDGQQELIKEFRDFATTMAENNSKALIEALEEVIRDFNAKINEQFGENFKQLNQAVSALLTWQEKYKAHVEALEHRIEMAVKAIESCEESLRIVAEHSGRIPESIAPLSTVLNDLRAITTNLEGQLQAISDLRDKAVEAFPIIESNVKALTDEFGKAVSDAVAEINSGMRAQEKSLADLHRGYGELETSAARAQQQFSQAMDDTLKGMRADISKAMDTHAAAIDASTKEVQRQINDAWTKTEETLGERLERLDNEMQEELKRALEVMGENLASLSEKFVSDYEPLTSRLREVVQIAGRMS